MLPRESNTSGQADECHRLCVIAVTPPLEPDSLNGDCVAGPTVAFQPSSPIGLRMSPTSFPFQVELRQQQRIGVQAAHEFKGSIVPTGHVAQEHRKRAAGIRGATEGSTASSHPRSSSGAAIVTAASASAWPASLLITSCVHLSAGRIITMAEMETQGVGRTPAAPFLSARGA